MSNSIFYHHGCRSALVKMGVEEARWVSPEEWEPELIPHKLNPWPYIGGHAAVGGALGAGAGALVGPFLGGKNILAGAASGALVGGGLKGLSSLRNINKYRKLEEDTLRPLRGDLKEFLSDEVGPSGRRPWDEYTEASDKLLETVGPGLKARIHGWKY